MKKFISILIIAVMVVSVLALTACGGGSSEDLSDSKYVAPTDDGFKTKGDMKLTFKDDGDKIKASIIGVDLVFERQ